MSAIMDLHAKKIISYTFSKRMITDCILQTLNKVKHFDHISEGMLLRRDLGGKYIDFQYKK